MWETHAIALLLLVAVLVAWVTVQGAWRRAFPDASSDPDVLARRGAGCGRCGCLQPCERRREREAAPKEDR